MSDEKRPKTWPMVEYELVDTDRIKHAITKLSDADSFGGLVPIEDVYTEVEKEGISSDTAGKIITRLINEGAFREEKWAMMLDPQDIDELYEKWKLKQASTNGRTVHSQTRREAEARKIERVIEGPGHGGLLDEHKARMGL